MATAEEYAAWIVQNKDKQGTPEFNTVAEAYKLAKANGLQQRIATQTEADRQTYDPTVGMTGTDRFFAGVGKGMTDAARGVGQLFGQVSNDDLAESRKRDAALLNTTSGSIGNIAGNVAALAPTAVIPGANTVVGAGLIGTGAGALTTPGDFKDRAFAGLVGGLGGAAGQALPAVFGTLRAAAEPLTEAGRNKIIGRVMNGAVGDDAKAVAARLRSAQPLIPGSMPTAAEVGESGGMAALQRAMSAADPEAYTHRGMQQSAARVSALRGIAGDEAKIAAAEQARRAAAEPLYSAAKATEVAGDAELTKLLNRPVMKEAWAKAQALAADKGETITLAAKKPTTVATVDASGAPILQDVAGEAAKFSGNGLHYLKMALDDMLDSAPTSGLGRNQKAAVMQNKNELLAWLENKIPEYGQASQAWAAGSKPINQMQIGQELLDKLSPALSDHGALAKETAAKYAQALRNGEQTARSATGFRQGLDEVMTPQQMGTLQSVAQDLARKANAQDLGRGVGSNTFQNFAMDNLSQSMGMPAWVKAAGGLVPGLSPTTTLITRGAQAAGKLAYKNADEQIRKDMAQALLNPQAAARLMESASSPGMLAKALQALPKSVTDKLPPEDILRLLQAAPGIAVTAPALAKARQQ